VFLPTNVFVCFQMCVNHQRAHHLCYASWEFGVCSCYWDCRLELFCWYSAWNVFKCSQSTQSFWHTSKVSSPVWRRHLTIIKWVASQVQLFLAMSQFDWLITHIKWVYGGYPKYKVLFWSVYSSSPLAHLYRWKEGNICQNIWDKSEVIWRTCWGTYWESHENLKGT
jgi:hypothetical protein